MTSVLAIHANKMPFFQKIFLQNTPMPPMSRIGSGLCTCLRFTPRYCGIIGTLAKLDLHTPQKSSNSSFQIKLVEPN